jgi:conserved oligomeric Golgi complex subunit 7
MQKGSLNDISTIYESMLQFLSLVYEVVTGCWIDLVESGSIGIATANPSTGSVITKNDDNKSSPVVVSDAPTLYKELKKVFIQIASPFAPYQKNLARLEEYYIRGQTHSLYQKMDQLLKTLFATNSVDAAAGWEILQTSTTDELKNITHDIIPIAEGSVARFELLSGGYDVTSSLQVIDRTLAGHATELTLIINKISSRFVSSHIQTAGSGGEIINSFDEGHVMCALHVLKIAGQHHRSMKSLQSKTRERLQLLTERMLAHVEREKQLEDAIHSTTFQLPESLSIVEVDSILTTSILNEGKVDNSCLKELKYLVDDTSFSNLYPETKEAAYGLAVSCQSFVFDVCFALPRYYLASISSMTVWKETESSTENWMTSSSYGTLPQAYMTHVGEHMLALVQALEPFATDRDALDVANEIMGPDHIRRVSYQFWYDFISSATGSAGTESLVKQLVDGKDLVDFVLGTIPIDDDNDDNNNDDNGDHHDSDDEHSKASTIFCNKWLDVIGLAVTGRLLERIMRIPSLSPKGCEQLNVDLGYIVNVLSALGIAGHPHVLLGHISEICTLDSSVISERINHFDRTNVCADFLRAIEERLSAMRGINN